MNRKKFLRNLGLFSGLVIGSPAIISCKSTDSDPSQTSDNNFALRKRTWEGHEPEILETPWEQNILCDRYTYIDLHNYIWRLEGFEWPAVREKGKELTKKIDDGSISTRKGPTRLVDGLWLIDVDGQQNIYLLASEEGLVLIDPGMDAFTDRIIEQIEALGYQKTDVRFILLTHCHVDHAQSAAFWRKNGARVLIHRIDLNAVATGNEVTAWWIVNDDKDRYFPPVKEGLEGFEDGDVLKFGSQKLYVCHTPGHTPGSSCFYLQRDGKHILISGDAIFHNGKHGWMGHPYVDYDAYIKSLWKLKNFSVEGTVHNEEGRLMIREPVQYDMLLPGHTAISMDMVYRDIDKGIEIMSYTIQERRKGVDYQWTEPYSFFAEREVTKAGPIQLEYR